MSDHHHHHSHNHSHHHPRPSATGKNRIFLISFGLNVAIVVLQVILGLLSNSLSLLADAGHNLSDVLGLVIAWIAVWLGQRRASIDYTYGLKRSTIVAAILNAALILVALGAIAVEALHRFQNPLPVQEQLVIGAASLGIVLNGFTAWLFAKNQHDLNMKGVFLHMLTDALVSVGVVLGAIAIMVTGQVWLDPAMGLVIVVLIFIGTWGLLKDAVRLILDGVPTVIEMQAVQTFFQEHPQVISFHHLHVWALSTTETALTVHLVVAPEQAGDVLLQEINQALAKNFGIFHNTIQLETTPNLGHCQTRDDSCYSSASKAVG
ncbi:MAG: cation diffusion facilitator family transporter [Synechocystis sp.]|nr:cation diffusion facilitator family transporter [Synechocystis sp.]